MEVAKFQAKISIPMVLLEVFEAIAVVDLDSGPINLIDDVFSDIRQVFRVHEDPLELTILDVYIIDFTYQAVLIDSFHFFYYLD